MAMNELFDIEALPLTHASKPGVDGLATDIGREIAEFHMGVVGEQVDDLVESAVIDAAMVVVAQTADLILVLKQTNPAFEHGEAI